MWSNRISNAFDNDSTLKDILTATYTSSTRRNYAVIKGADKSILAVGEELIQKMGSNIAWKSICLQSWHSPFRAV